VAGGGVGAGARALRRFLPARRFGVRGRVTLGFGLLALGLSALLSGLAWTLVTRAMVSQTEQTALVETSLDRGEVETALSTGVADLPTVLEGVPGTDSAAVLAQVDGRWYATSPSLGPASLPTALVSVVTGGQVSTQRIRVDGTLHLAVGLPLAGGRGTYFEIYSLDEMQRTARALSLGLVAAAVVTVLIGLGVGRFASRLALRPLTELNRVAADVAAGQLSARLDADGDPDLEELAGSFNRTVADLQRHVVADARFAVDVSHELRTPMTTMLNSMQVIQNRREQLPESVREPVDLLADELERFRALVVDLLEISRHDAGDQVVRETVRVGDLVSRAADAAAGRVVTSVDPAVVTLTMEVDKRRLERVVANLVGNAETHGGGCTAVRVEPGATGLRVVVEDAGPGIPAARRARVFERFARGGSHERTGVGLGLAIVQRHVALHEGQVLVEERPGGGARFVVELPTSTS
jgi:two-component system sensor histidine kinase MtrB